MKKITLILMLLAISSVSVFGQNKQEIACTNQMAEKISSRGVSLGMSQEETLNLFVENGKFAVVSEEYLQDEGRTKVTIIDREYAATVDALQKLTEKTFGYSSVSLAPQDKIKFDGISRYDLGFLDNRLVAFRVYYSKPKWEYLEQFANKLSELLNLPKPQPQNNDYLLKCGDYSVVFDSYSTDDGDRYWMRVSADIDKIINQRRKKADDEQREKDIKSFKP